MLARIILLLTLVSALGAVSGAAAPLDLQSDEFPIGMYSADSEGAMRQCKEMGITYVHTYGMCREGTPEGIAKDRAYLDKAQQQGVKAMAYLNGKRWVTKDAGRLEELRTLVRALKDHPALGMWLLYDEPDGKFTPQELLPFYRMLKEETPNVPVVIVEAWTKTWWESAKACDLFMVDAYPIYDEEFPASKLDSITRFSESAIQRAGKPVAPVLQCFNWKALPEAAKSRGKDVAKLRYPNTSELRYFSYSSLAMGARGLFWWSYYHSVRVGYGWMGREFAPVIREVREFTDLVKPAHKPVVFERARDDNLHMALYQRPTGTYLVLVNAWPLERDIRRNTEGKLSTGRLEPWGKTRDAKARLENGQVIVRAGPWETFVWKVAE